MVKARTIIRQAGFTYIGLLIAFAVISVFMGATAQVWHTAMQREKERQLLFVGNEFRQAIALYFKSHGKAYPPSLEDLLKDPLQPTTKRYLRKIYHDPITGGTEWGFLQGPTGGIVGVHSLSDAQPLKIAGFSKADSSFEQAEKYSDWVFSYLPSQPQKIQPANTSSAPFTTLAPLKSLPGK